MLISFDRLDGERPQRAAAFLHGILGRGINWRTIARRFVLAHPEWAALLVDLRGHGRSPKNAPAPSLEAAARDVVDLAPRAGFPVAAVVGHSFGGKVALEVARADALPALEHVFVIDSVPGSRATLQGADSALGVIATLEAIPQVFSSKVEFVRAVIAAGQPRGVAEWLATSVEKKDGGFRFALDLNEIRALILDYFARDLWPVVEHPPDHVSIHLIIADQSDTYSRSDRERAKRIAASNSRVTADVLPGGHWLHVDNADGLLQKLTV